MPSLSFKNQFELCKTNNSLNSNLGGWRDLKLLYPPTRCWSCCNNSDTIKVVTLAFCIIQ